MQALTYAWANETNPPTSVTHQPQHSTPSSQVLCIVLLRAKFSIHFSYAITTVLSVVMYICIILFPRLSLSVLSVYSFSPASPFVVVDYECLRPIPTSILSPYPLFFILCFSSSLSFSTILHYSVYPSTRHPVLALLSSPFRVALAHSLSLSL